MSYEYPVRVPVRIVETQQELPVPVIPRKVSWWHLGAGIALAGAALWWSTRQTVAEDILSRTEQILKEKEKKKFKLKALAPLKPISKLQRPSRIGEFTPEMIGMGEMVFAPELGALELGRISEVPGIPPVGAVLPTFTGVSHGMLGGLGYSYGDLGDFEEPSAADLQHFEVALEEAYNSFEEFTGINDILSESGAEFIEWLQTNMRNPPSPMEIADKWAEGELEEEWDEFRGQVIHDGMNEWNGMTFDIKGSEGWEMFPYIQREMDRYGTARFNLAVVNRNNGRAYHITDVYERFLFRSLGEAFSVDSINWGNLNLVGGPKEETYVDGEIRRAMSQYLTSSAYPWSYVQMKYHEMTGDAGCEAHVCYDPPLSIMDENLQIVKNFGEAEDVECEEIGEYGGSYSYYVDYCYHFAELLRENAKKGLSGKTWNDSPWELDTSGCGMHVQVKGEWYSVPADEMMKYAYDPGTIVPRYLQGKGCPIFLMVTPDLQEELEQQVLDAEYIQSSRMMDVEPRVMVSTMNTLFQWFEEIYPDRYQQFIGIYERDGAKEANKYFILDMLPEFEEQLDAGIDVAVPDQWSGTHLFTVIWRASPEGFILLWAQGEPHGRGTYLIEYSDLMRYVYNYGKGNPTHVLYKPVEG